jgi:hypothetical protein
MKIEITIPTPSVRSLRPLTLLLFLLLSAVLLWQLGLAAFLLFLGFSLLLLAIGFAWASVTTSSDQENLTLEEALDVAAPDRDEERKLAVLRGIKDLEYERSLGKISEPDYAELMQRYRNDAKLLLQKLDTSEAALRERALRMTEEKLAKVEQSKAHQSEFSESKPG